MIIRLFCLLFMIVQLTNCHSHLNTVTMKQPMNAETKDRLEQLADAYYSAKKGEELEQIVAQAKLAGPESYLYHEIAADLANLRNHPNDMYEHLYQALLAPDNDATLIHLNMLSAVEWSRSQSIRNLALFETLANNHWDHTVRAEASYSLMNRKFLMGDVHDMPRLVKMSGWRLPMTVIGTFDNEQGKGFDTVYPPELEIDFKKYYQGQLIEIGWRENLPVDHFEEMSFDQIMHPDQWAVAYALSTFDVEKEGDYEIRMASSAPVKLWLNGNLLVSEKFVSKFSMDSFVVPVKLGKGPNVILVKSAQETGDWELLVRLTGTDGQLAPAGTFKATKLESVISPATLKGGNPLDGMTAAAYHVRQFTPETARIAFMYLYWLDHLGLDVKTASIADTILESFPDSLRMRYDLAYALWSNGEHSRTSDIVEGLVSDASDDMVLFPIMQARFWWQNELTRKARQSLIELGKIYNDRPFLWSSLAEIFEEDEWLEDECEARDKALFARPQAPSLMIAVAECRSALGFHNKAQEIYRSILRWAPNYYPSMEALRRYAMKNHDYYRAEIILNSMLRAWPLDYSVWQRMGSLKHLQGDSQSSDRALLFLANLVPTAPSSFNYLGHYLYRRGDKDLAIAYWKEALARNPSSNYLSNRLDFLDPPKSGPWADDVPSEAVIDKAIALRDTIKFDPAADHAILLDHMVTELNSDGSTIHIFTFVQHSLNETGRDRMLKFTLPKSGRTRILHAFAIDPSNKRIEASSIRGREIRFRQLEIGSSTVVQYRHNAPPDSLMNTHYNSSWRFQSDKVQFVRSQLILWTPKDTKLSTHLKGDVVHEKQEMEKHNRYFWSGENIPVFVSEIGSPSLRELMWSLEYSTIPDWNEVAKLEITLLRDIFREDPSLVKLADDLFDESHSAMEKLNRIQIFLMKEIRYQKDYERMISGVKPHAAPMVLARRYGDCKDKTVLFITLAKMAGIKAQYTLLRTRQMGPIQRDVPNAGEFNHAIVYIPVQDGVSKELFFDPTAEELDVGLLPSVDQGVWSMVIDPEEESHQWKFIPFEDPETAMINVDGNINLNEDGSGEGTIEFTAKGKLASIFRKMARNPDNFSKFSQGFINVFFPGSTLKNSSAAQVDDLTLPAILKIEFSNPTLANKEGRTLRFIPHIGWNPGKYFSLETRKHPLNLGTYETEKWNLEIHVPKGARIKKIPKKFKFDSEFLTCHRSIKKHKSKFVVAIKFQRFNDRMEAEAYPGFKKKLEHLRKAAKKQVVISLKKSKKKKSKKKSKKK